MKDKIQGESFWVGAIEDGEHVKWIENITSDDSKNYNNMFDEHECYTCKYRPGKCGSLDLMRGSNQYLSTTNRWKFSDCEYKCGFICQIRSKNV